jgi:hypothetical protein
MAYIIESKVQSIKSMFKILKNDFESYLIIIVNIIFVYKISK